MRKRVSYSATTLHPLWGLSQTEWLDRMITWQISGFLIRGTHAMSSIAVLDRWGSPSNEVIARLNNDLAFYIHNYAIKVMRHAYDNKYYKIGGGHMEAMHPPI